MSNPESHEDCTPRRWQDLLSTEDRERLQDAYRKLFPKKIEDGYEVVDEVGTESGRLLRAGPFIDDIQTKTAHAIIEHLKHLDAMEELHGWGLPLRDYNVVFDSEKQAMVPPKYWQNFSVLSIRDIKLDRLGITIFAKKVPRK